MRRLVILCALALAGTSVVADDAYRTLILEDRPVAHWRLDGDSREVRNAVQDALHGSVVGNVDSVPGARPSEYPDRAPDDRARAFPMGPNYVIVADPGENSDLDFDNGDALTLEAWVRWDQPLSGGYPYIVGKGRTHNPGVGVRNQNYSLRLATAGGGPFISFFFVDAETPTEGSAIKDEGHRWTSTEAVPNDGAWHYVAVTYEFGKADSLRGYIDGRPVKGKWDMGGETAKRPVVDNDELWIGSALQGGSTFGGELDEVAIYRTALSPERIATRYRVNLQEAEFAIGKIREDEVPKGAVRAELFEGVARERSWDVRLRQPTEVWETDVFALTLLPRKYDHKGLIVDRKIPSLLHLTTRIEVPPGEYRFVIRSLDATRLYIDGKLVADTPLMDKRSDGHQELYVIPEVPEGVLSIPAAHNEADVVVTLAEGSHVISLYRLLGSGSTGMRVGDLCVGYGPVSGSLQFLAPARDLPFNDETWITLLDEERNWLRDYEQLARREASAEESEYWNRRHDLARELAPAAPEPPAAEFGAAHPLDRFINAQLAAQGSEPLPLVDDFAFLRRLALDTTGVIPTEAQILEFFNEPAETRRTSAIDRFLADPGWADHWVGYWQDVLAENPGLTKPKLNNSGPFRWFVYESFLDNKPFDRFVTELVLMEGGQYAGGPAGFAMASENDVPMAAKAHIVGTAFLAVEMKCARCHDAPYHDSTQGDLFGLAAMLNQAPQKIPGSSSVPGELLPTSVVKVSLPPGSTVKPNWPFADLASDEAPEIPDGVLRSSGDTREDLAARLTLPSNVRFARVIVNRLWQRYLGRGLIEPVDDWQDADCAHPDLLDYLAHELITHDYDLKHVARLIFTSDVYQRVPNPGLGRDSDGAELFAGPVRRRVTGEQLTDSIHRAVGKDLGSEELTMDGDGRRPDDTFLDMGTPHRAWEFVAVSNERDRPSMSLPVAQGIVDLLMAYGWRQQRQEPITIRDESLTPLQPMLLANGVAVGRAVDLTDYGGLTDLVLEEQPLETLVERLFQRFLTRPPTSDERETLVALLAEGYEDRVIAGPDAVPPQRVHRSPRTWSNHLHPTATDVALARIAEVEAGERPSVRLDPDWRERAEDAVWTLINLPEFVFVP